MLWLLLLISLLFGDVAVVVSNHRAVLKILRDHQVRRRQVSRLSGGAYNQQVSAFIFKPQFFFHLAVVAVWVHRFILWLWIFLSMREREEAGWKTNASPARAPLCKNSKNHAKAGAISIGIDQFSSTPDRPEALNLRWKEANQRIGKC